MVSKDINLDIHEGEFVVFVGPSGCGKSTLLRMIAGLETITSGDLFIGEKRMNDTPPAERGVGMVFQSYALYPHLSVAENMSFGLKLAGAKKEVINQRVNQVAEVLQLAHLLDRKPKALSGGQRQRVAIGRTLVAEPSVFLLDEPLSNLDAALRVQMRIEISRLHKRLGRTMIYVHPRSGRSDDAGRQNRGAGRRSRGAGWETAGAVPLSGRPFCRRIYRFAKDELPAGKSDRHRNRSSAGGAADAKSSASLAAS
ncbi:maltose/maltodextrin transporter ATP-binding protein [Escherichia coli]|uniref:Maltose/maltodextrin transporter ATP-binding protein n=1 Tax=Escherichia coli TaxID=562 RepID=A0A376L4G6_ECOLX|nr:maltose/maltodextrin transporter ATP-binding protein [Escherichia coli]